MKRIILVVLIVSALVVSGISCGSHRRDLPAVFGPDVLKEHQRIFAKRIEKVGGNVYSAIGYGLANSIMVVVDGGKVIIDTTESVMAASQIKAEFDKIAPGPVLAIIYTHTHADHIIGASVFYEPGIPIYAHALAPQAMNDQFASLGTTIRKRAAKQFGGELDEQTRLSNGIGPMLQLDPGPVPPLIYPTHTFSGELKLTIGGVDFVLHEAPGETRDHIFIWLPQSRVLMPGDNIYQAFPNLYSTRGVPPRPVRGWIRSLEIMRDLKPAFMTPSHTGTVSGEEEIRQLLTDYRDAIAFVHDSVIRMANQGKSPDDMVREIHLPPRLAAHPYLQEFYGKVSWSVRGIYDGYLGWFDGNPTNLSPLHPSERSEKMIPLLGGREKILAEIQRALSEKQMQWAAELSDILLFANPNDSDAKAAKAKALRYLGANEINPNARCYLISSALELEGKYKDPPPPNINAETLGGVPIEVILSTFPERLDPDKTSDVEMTVGFEFVDTQKYYALFIRKGVGEFATVRPKNPDLVFIGTEQDFKAFIIGDLSPAKALATGRIKTTGGLSKLLAFKSYLLKP